MSLTIDAELHTLSIVYEYYFQILHSSRFNKTYLCHATSTKVCVSDEVAFELINHLEQICFQARIFKVESMYDKYSKVEIETLLKPQN